MKYKERGNIFFTLFGAVAIVGVLGAATVSMMRGPLSTMVEVNRRTMADTQMQIATKLALLNASMDQWDGDCEASGGGAGDAFVEPIEWEGSGVGPASVAGSEGGGWLPASVGASQTDPWGTRYGYCVWDAGTMVDDANCGGAAQNRLPGNGLDHKNYPVLAIISAGPDRTFDTGCVSFAKAETDGSGTVPNTYEPDKEHMIVKPSGADDLILEYTYSEASATSGGLWSLSTTDPDTATIDKNIDVADGGTFGAPVKVTDTSGAYNEFPYLKADFIDKITETSPKFVSGLDLENTATEGDGCSAIGSGVLGVEGTSKLLMCLGSAGSETWVAIGGVGGVGGKWQDGTDAGDIYYSGTVGINTMDPDEALAVSGNIALSGDVIMGDGKFVKWGTTTVTGANNGTLSFATSDGGTGSGMIEMSNVGDVGIGTSSVAGQRLTVKGETDDDTAAALNVTDSSGASVLYARNDGKVGVGGDTSPTDTLDVTGSIDLTDYLKIDDKRILSADDASGSGTLFLGLDAPEITGTTGVDNTVIGTGAALTLDAGVDNTILGAGAGAAVVGGGDNILIGQGVAPSLVSGQRNIVIGVDDSSGGTVADVPAADSDDYLNIGNVITGSLSSGSISISGSLNVSGTTESGDYTWQGIDFTPPNCGANEYSRWSDGWSCQLDEDNENTDNELQTLSEVLARSEGTTAAGDAENQDAYNFKDIYDVTTLHVGTSGPAEAGVEFEVEGDGLIDTLNIAGSGNVTVGYELEVNGDILTGTLSAGGTTVPGLIGVDGSTIDSSFTTEGYLGIGDTSPDTGTGGQLYLDVEGNIGAVEFCNEAGSSCFLASDVASGTSPAPGADEDVIFNVGGVFGADTGEFVYESGTNELGIGIADPLASIHTTGDAIFEGGNIFAAHDGAVDADNDFLAYDDALGFGGAAGIWHFHADEARTGAVSGIPTAGISVAEAYIAGDMVLEGTDLFMAHDGAADADNDYLSFDDAAALNGITGVFHMHTDEARGALWDAPTAGLSAHTGHFSDGLAVGSTTLSDGSGGGGQLLEVDVTGDLGAVYYCDENGLNCFTAASVVSGGGGMWERDDTDGDTVFVLRPDDAHNDYANDDFVFGSGAIDSTGGQAARMFFDKSNAAFYAGTATGALWDAPGANSFVLGNESAANAADSIALGRQAIVTATGTNSMAIGLGSTAGTAPQVSAANSLGIFLGDQDSADLAQANTVAIMGGSLGVGLVDPGNALEVVGTVESSTGFLTADDQTLRWGDGSVSLAGNATADSMTFTTAGGTVFTIDSGGNLAVGSAVAEAKLDVQGTGAILFPRGTSGEQPAAPVNGMMRYNSSDSDFEVYAAGAWQKLVMSGTGSTPDRINDADNDTYVDVDDGADDDTIRFATAGTERMRIGAGGDVAIDTDTLFVDQDINRVGIGTATPQASLEISSGQVFLPDGVAATPALSFSSDTDTGIYSIGADVLGLAIGGSEQYRFNATGLGIGGTDPLVSIHTTGGLLMADNTSEACNAGTKGTLTLNAAGDTIMICDGAAGTWTALAGSAAAADRINDADNDTYVDTDSADDDFIRFGTDGSERMVVSATGQVGIGTDAPDYLLEVAGDGTASGDTIFALSLDETAPNDGNLLKVTDSGDVTAGNDITAGQDVIATRNVSGVDVSASGEFFASSGAAATPSITFTGDVDTGFYSAAADALGVALGGADALRLNATGLGVGNIDPKTRLDVTGTLRVADGGEACDVADHEGAIKYTVGDDKFQVCADSATGWVDMVVGSMGAFTSLTDTPAAYAGAAADAYKVVQVNPTGDGLAFSGTGATMVAGGATGDRPGTGIEGMMRYNTTDSDFEVYAAGAWRKLVMTGSGASSDRIEDQNDGNTYVDTDDGADNNIIRFGTDGSERMRILSTGEIGIGTLFPTQEFEVSDLIIDGAPCGAGYSTGDYDGDTTADDCKLIGLTVDKTAGKVGIGADDPAAVLEVAGDGTADGTSVFAVSLDNTAVNEASLLSLDDNGDLVIGNNITAGNDITSGNDITAGRDVIATRNVSGVDISASGEFLASAGAAATPSITFTGDVDTGFYSIGADVLGLTIGGAEQYRFNTTGLGIGGTDPVASIHTSGGLLMADNTSETCNAASKGTLTLNAGGDTIMICDGSAGTWTALAGSAAAADRINDTDNDTYVDTDSADDDTIRFGTAGSERMQIQPDGDFLVYGTHDGTASVPVSGAGTRMFFDPQKSAFRAGAVDGTQWDDASVGEYSIAMGNNTTSSGSSSTAMGINTTASGMASMAIGRYVHAGDGTVGSGDGSFAIGLIDDAVTITADDYPQVTGVQSMGIFMGNQDPGGDDGNPLIMSADNTFGLFGGSMVIDPNVPATQLSARSVIDVGAATDAILFPRGDGANRPGTPVNGMMRYNTANGKFEAYQGGAWQDILTSAVGNVATSVSDEDGDTLIQVEEGADDDTIRFDTAGAERAVIQPDGDFMVYGTYDGTASVPATGAGTRMFFDPQKAAFRAGYVDGTQWDDANVGNYSVAIGKNARASGGNSVAIGQGANAYHHYGVAIGEASKAEYGGMAMGWGAEASDDYTLALGGFNIASEERSAAVGYDNTASGYDSNAFGSYNTASGWSSTAMGFENTASDYASIAMGYMAQASGSYSTAMGNGAFVGDGTPGNGKGDGSMAITLKKTDTWSDGYQNDEAQVTGQESLGIFMGFHDDGDNETPSVIMSADNTFGLFGGSMVIDPAVPATQLSARAVIDVGAATDAIVFPAGTTGEQPGAPVNGMMRYNSSDSDFEVYAAGAWQKLVMSGAGSTPDRINDADNDTYIDVDDGADDDTIRFGTDGSERMQIQPDGDFMVYGTYDGTASVPASGAGTRMFFDPQKAAFRAGYVDGTQWDDASVGDYSVAMGYNTTASLTYSVAMGYDNTSSGYATIAMGGDNTSSGMHSVAMGFMTTATQDGSTAMGRFSDATGEAATALGNGAEASGFYSSAIGEGPTSSGRGSIALGAYTTASGTYSTAMGRYTTASGWYSTAMGVRAFAGSGTAGDGTGDGSMAIGLMKAWDTVTTDDEPQVTGQESLGIFMGAQDPGGDDGNPLIMSADNTFGLFGGSMVIDPNVPATQLSARGVIDVGAATDAIVLPSGTSAQQPGTAVAGMFRYNSDDSGLEFYNGSAWEPVVSGTVDTDRINDADNDTYIDVDDGADDDTIRFATAGTERMQIQPDGDLLVTGTYDGTASVPATGAGTRMFFDPQKAAFRAGRVTGTQWDDASVGEYSVAMGYGTEASGSRSTAMGWNTTASATYSTAMGGWSTASGEYSVAMGRDTTASGSQSTAMGYGPTASGDSSTAMGAVTTASGSYSTAMGGGTTASGDASTAMGRYTTASGYISTAMGNRAFAGDGTAGNGAGDGSMAIGLMKAWDTVTSNDEPQVTGQESLGIFMGAQDDGDNDTPSVIMSADNTFGLFGGQMVIDPAVPATQLSARGVIDVGAATDAIVLPVGTSAQQPGSPEAGMFRYNSDDSGLEFYNGSSWEPVVSGTVDTDRINDADNDTYIDVDDGADDDTIRFATAGTERMQIQPDGDLLVTGTYDGTASVPATGAGTRMFFDPQKAAFRAGAVSGTDWDDANVGDYSVAMGNNTTASGHYSTAMGRSTTASGYAGTAMGYKTEASGSSSTAMGYNTEASGSYNTAMGSGTTASGFASTAMGWYSTASGNYSTAMGDRITASGTNSTAMGREAIAGSGTAGDGAGDYAFAVGLLDDAHTTDPMITGDRSMGLFMGTGADAQSNLDLQASDVLAVFGGRMLIDPRVKGDDVAKVVADADIRGTLDLGYATDAMVLPSGTSAQQPGTAVAGMFRYNSDDSGLEFYNGSSWEPVVSGTVDTDRINDADNDTYVDVDDGADDDTIRFATAGTERMQIQPDGDLLVTGTFDGTASVPASGAGTRMFFDPQKAAFRAGYVDGTEWDDASVGDYSVAMGDSTIASGNGSTAMGGGTTASGIGSTAMGRSNTASGYASTAMGRSNTASGGYSTAMGRETEASGDYSTAMGDSTATSGYASTAMGNSTTASGSRSTAMGSGTTASGSFSTAMGYQTEASGEHSTAMGKYAMAGSGTAADGTGDGSFALGLIDNAVSITADDEPRVTGIQSMGIFMGNQDPGGDDGNPLIMSADNTFGLFGGSMVIDPNVPATQLSARGVIDVGAATDAIVLPSGTSAQQPGTAVAGMFRYNSDDSAVEFYNGASWTTLDGEGDNLGNHIATQALDMATYNIQNTGGVEFELIAGLGAPLNANDSAWTVEPGVDVSTTLKVGIGTNAPGADLEISQGAGSWPEFRLTAGDVALPDFSASPYLGDISGTSTFGQIRSSRGALDNVSKGGLMVQGLTESAVNDWTPLHLVGTHGGTGPVTAAAVTISGQKHSGTDDRADLSGSEAVLDVENGYDGTLLFRVKGDGDVVMSGTGALTLPSGTSAQQPGAAVAGMFRYNSTDSAVEFYNGSSWTTLDGAGTPGGADRQIQFNNSGAFGASSDFVYTADGDFIVGSDQLDDLGDTTDDYRMFYDVSKGAFRAGYVTGADWDDAQVGENSAAFGYNTRAYGLQSFAMGDGTDATGEESTAMGFQTTASGIASFAVGGGPTASGYASVAMGRRTDATGAQSTAMGGWTTASGDNSTAMGGWTTASGDNSTAMGGGTTASGNSSTAMGRYAYAGSGTAGDGTGDGSFAIGLIDDAITITENDRPQVTGIQSMGIFMGNQDPGGDDGNPLIMSADNTFGLFGGQMVIDPNVPATQLSARGVIDVGAATDAIVLPSGTSAQQPGTAVAGMFRYNSDDSGLEFYNGSSWEPVVSGTVDTDRINDADNDTYVDVDDGADDDTIRFATAGTERMQIQPDGDLLVTGTYDGTASVPATGAGTRMFFDPQKAAFRAGYVDGTQWDDANVGEYSVAMGYKTEASGSYSTAMGYNTTASGWSSTAMGYDTEASSSADTAMGYDTEASGTYSTAMGDSTTASGWNSTAMGFSTTASGFYSTAMGQYTEASGWYSTAMGKYAMAGSGTAADGTGDGSFAIGLIDDAVTITADDEPRVTGIQSMGIFMGNQDPGGDDGNPLIMSADNTFGLFGGSMVIDPNVPATQLSANYTLHVVGDAGKTGGGSWSVASDARLKDVQGAYEYGLDEIMRLRPVRFSYKEDNPRGLPSDTSEIGFIAQEVREVMPEAVSELDDGYLDFNMHPVNVAMVGAVKELKAENDELRAELEDLSKQVALLNKTAVKGTGKASMENWMVLLFAGMLGVNMLLLTGFGIVRRRG